MSSIIDKATDFVQNLLSNELGKNCLYHNITHTLRVYKSTKEIIENTTLTPEDGEILLLSVLFHDTGYIKGCYNHEKESSKIATTFLKENNINETIIEKVIFCIMATKIDAQPKNDLEKIIRDADTSHFAKKYYKESSELLRQELKKANIKNFNKEEWLTENIIFLKSKHTYYSDYAIKYWNPKKEENLKKMMKARKNNKKKKEEEKKQLQKYLKSKDPERAIQSVFRITLKNHIKLSDIADTKANILLSVNAIILSIALSSLIPKLDNPSNQHLIIPTIIFIIFTVITMILAVLATRPNVTSGKFTKKDVENKSVNLLFFGNFHKMTLDEFEWAMNEMLLDKEYIYSSMTKDLYFLGLVLQRKYSLLRITYNIFMIGIVAYVLGFAIAIALVEN
ncbi:MAG: HD domain-containing protein [Bacteroidetes bacterium]|nr:HD domain-containing protein [Bacteroidota bacterium]